MNLGNVPEWLGAIGTVRALFFAPQTLRQDHKDARLRDEDRRREQATKVSVWPIHPVIDDPARAPRNRRYPTIKVVNASGLPIFELWMLVVFPETNTETILDDREVLPPGEFIEQPLPDDLQVVPGFPVSRLVLRFRDASGRRWVRTGAGDLHTLEEWVNLWEQAKNQIST
jgi:hypothetical protein